MKERPILFSGAMVRAILAGDKTQTRRVVQPAPAFRLVEPRVGVTVGMDPADDGAIWYDSDGKAPGRPVRCPYGRIGHRLWVRESGRTISAAVDHDGRTGQDIWADVGFRYAADGTARAFDGGECDPHGNDSRPTPSIHMPRRACRLVLEITNIRAERLQSISDADAVAEGPPLTAAAIGVPMTKPQGETMPRAAFTALWDSLNDSRGYGWAVNPWVWAITFRKVGTE